MRSRRPRVPLTDPPNLVADRIAGPLPCDVGAALASAGFGLAIDLPEMTAIIAGVLVLLAGTASWHYGFVVRPARRYLAFG